MKSLGGDSGRFLDLASEHPAKDAIRRRLTHMGSSSLCDRLAGSCLGEVSSEEGARLFFRVLGRRLVVLEPVAEMADARSQLRDIEIMMDPRITGQSDRRAIRPACATISRHGSTGLASSASPIRIKVGAVMLGAGMTQLG